eukprot:7052529-Pyramimonas_sp.AAC.1
MGNPFITVYLCVCVLRPLYPIPTEAIAPSLGAADCEADGTFVSSWQQRGAVPLGSPHQRKPQSADV